MTSPHDNLVPVVHRPGREGGTDLEHPASRQINRRPMCEVAHMCFGIGKLSVVRLPAALGGLGAMKGAMPRTNLWSQNVPRVELDQRSRECAFGLSG
jgi:hypothetical protein